MKSIRVYPPESRTYNDRLTGIEVRQLTNYLGHSNHQYFTVDPWFEHEQKMLFYSDRDNATNLFALDIDSGELHQLTDFMSGEHRGIYSTDVNHARNEVYGTIDGVACAFELDTLQCRPLWKLPEGMHGDAYTPSASGGYVYTYVAEEVKLVPKRFSSVSPGYLAMRQMLAAKPLTQIWRIDVETGRADMIWEEHIWLNHVNTSKRIDNILTFAHEGPWDMVDQRMWVLNTDTREAVKLRERRMPGEQIGHEYWYRDGVTVGYQVHTPAGEHFFGQIRYDNTEMVEGACEPGVGADHIHSTDGGIIVSDAGSTIKAYKRGEHGYAGPYVVCTHDGSFHRGSSHPHPRIMNDGKRVIFNSDVSGYCNIYLTQIPDDIATLPLLDELKQNSY